MTEQDLVRSEGGRNCRDVARGQTTSLLGGSWAELFSKDKESGGLGREWKHGILAGISQWGRGLGEAEHKCKP